MLFDPARHEALRSHAWDEGRVRDAIGAIVRDTEERFAADACWPIHPLDADDGTTRPLYPLYFGACGVIFALRHLEALGAVRLAHDYARAVDELLPGNRAWLDAVSPRARASYLMGDTGIELLRFGLDPAPQTAERLAALIAGNLDNPARELMWGAPGTLLAALFLHERTADMRWSELFCRTADTLWSQLQWSTQHACHYWAQDMYGQSSTYTGGVHGFAATASPLIRGRHLLAADTWAQWERCIVNTVSRSATREGALANWRAWLETVNDRPPRMLMQFCHGAPGFIVCLGKMPGTVLDELLIAGGEAVWAAGPLRKGANLCHGTGGNGYTFLTLYARTGDAAWLERARAFAMHALAQSEADVARYAQRRYSLWTGDLGLAIYLWDCIRAKGEFPSLEVFFAD
jgi:hypothetical protein